MKDLKRAGARALVIVGESQPPAVHALAHAMNEALGAVGTTVTYTDPAEAAPVGQAAALAALVGEMQAGAVEVLVILGSNPAYAAPADLKMREALDKVPLRIHHGLYLDETAERCHWHLPASHPLESWGDLRAADGTVSIVQPLIAPLYNTLSDVEVVAAFGEGEQKGYEVLRARWEAELGSAEFEKRWNRALHDGIVAGTAFAPKAVKVAPGAWAKAGKASAAGGLEIAFRADPSVYDGRFANLGWLQELPKPLSKITWDNVALVSPKTAAALGGVRTEQTASGHTTEVAELRLGGRSVKAPLWVLPGHADGAVTVHLGFGRTRAGQVGTGVGFDAYALRTSDAAWAAGGLEVVKTGETALIACTQDHWTMEATAQDQAHERHLVRAVTLAELVAGPPRRPEDGPRAGTRPLDVPRAQVRGARLGHGDRHERVRRLQRLRHRLPVREQHPGGGEGPGRPRPRDAVDPRRPLLRGPRRRAPRPTTSRSCACTARTPLARWSARWRPRCTARKASTTWSTTAAWGRGTARTTAPTRCGGSTSSSTRTGRRPPSR